MVLRNYMDIGLQNYRGIFGCSGILFNHESPMRGETFISENHNWCSKLSKNKSVLQVGNLDAERDWDMQRIL